MSSETSSRYLCASGADCLYAGKLADLQEQIAKLQALVRTDELTGLYNYRFIAENLPLEMERSRRSFAPLSLILLDVDHFKAFNDQWGHEAGNRALVHLADIVKQSLRKLDYACRFGGEEFLLILPNTDLPQATKVAERLREFLVASSFALEDGRVHKLTASLGVDMYLGKDYETPEQFLQRVDELLYKAKGSGRNCVVQPEHIDQEVHTQITQEEKDILFGAFGDSAN